MSKELITKLEAFRRDKGLSNLALCRLLGIYPLTYRRWKKTGHITEAYKRLIENFLSKKNQTPGKEVGSKASGPASLSSDIAVIGIGCYYPGASNVRELWENIVSRRIQFRRMLDQRLPLSEYYNEDPKYPDTTYLTKAAFLENYQFDWGKLRIPKKTVESTDIAHWLALDIALKTFEDAGYKLSEIPLQNTGVIVGNTLTGEQTRSQTLRLRWPFVQKALNATLGHRGMSLEDRSSIAEEMEQIYKSAFYAVTEDSLAGGLANTIAGRICNYLNLKGGGYIVDGACSSSLLAVATAADALKMGNMDLALAGGVDISLDPFELVGFAKAGALAKDQMRVYDQRAAGFLPGEGCGFVLLKRLNDAIRDKNYVYATIKGWGISSDGKGGIMEPSSSGQSFAIGRAYKDLAYKISDVDFVEGHGTGTTKGDKVELEGISTAIEKSISSGHKENHSCGVTSFKSIVGHTKAAAGVGGLIKAVLAVNQRVLPPTASCTEPNEVFENKARFLYPIIQGGLLDESKIARAGISSAGFGGINCHITIESKDKPKESLRPKIDERALFVSQQQTEVFVFSSRSSVHLKKIIQRFKEDLRNISIAEMADLAALLNKKVHKGLPVRVAIVADSPEHLYEALSLLEKEIDTTKLKEGQNHKIETKSPNTYIVLSNDAKRARIGFIYPGQGSQRLNMGRVLVERFPWARDLLAISKIPLYDHIYKGTDKIINKEDQQKLEKNLTDTKITQPAIILNSLIWSEFLAKLGVEPECVAGHSLGELTAFYKAGAFNKEILISFAELRGSLMAQKGSGRAGMAGLLCSRQKAEDLISKISGNVVIANINSPSQIVVSGGNKEIGKVLELAAKAGISSRRLNVSNAFHSSYMKEASDKIKSSKVLQGSYSPNSIGMYSGMVGALLDKKVELKEYFSKQVISPVNFVNTIEAISKECDVLIEVGPGRVLTDLAKAINKDDGPICLPIESAPQSDRDLNIVLAELYIRNVAIRWEQLYQNRLIKVFVPASRKSFIENQCERPLKLGNQILKNEVFQTISKREEGGQQPEEIIPGGLPVVEGKDNIADLLVDLTHNITGFDKSSISLESRLLDDLNLDSIKAAELIGQVARALGIAGQLDPSKLSNNTLGDIRNRLFELAESRIGAAAQGGSENVFKRYQNKTWVRNFIPSFVAEEIKTRNVNQLKEIKEIVLLYEKNEESLSKIVSKEFTKNKVQLISFGKKAELPKDKSIDCLVAILPKGLEYKELNAETLKEIYSRAHQVIDIATSNRMHKDSFVVLVGFGNSNFGENDHLKNIASSCMKSLISTLCLERPDLKVRILDFYPSIPETEIAAKIIDELQTYDRFSAVGYNAKLVRKIINYSDSQPSNYTKRGTHWSKKDVVMVTGGAKGITAECALEFVRSTKARIVIVGRSPLPRKKDDNNEILKTLQKFKNEGFSARYYQCDVTNRKKLENTIDEIRQKVGKITGFIHGAGLNSLQRLKQSSVDEAFKESLPKVLGAVNVCNALTNDLKFVAGITSIIGVTGMEGSGWYGLANEVLNLFLHQYKNQNPNTEVVTIAYSVWDEVGMGAKLGSVEKLAAKGIGAIPINEGVSRFRQLVECNPGVQQVIVTARLAGLDTWKSPNINVNGFRFIEKVEYLLPNVELIVRANINIKDDPYILDHNWKGSLLFPFVFGFEAMSQTVACVLGVEDFENIKAKKINLERPINVPIETGTNIVIHAEVLEIIDGKQDIKVEIYSQESAYLEPHFSAVFEINAVSLITNNERLLKGSKEIIDLDVKTDLYGPILFQGKLFQCIENVHELKYNEKQGKGETILTTVYKKTTEDFLKSNKKFNNRFVIGDPFFIDSMLQSIQLVITPHMSLPNYIEEISLQNLKNINGSSLLVHSVVNRVDEKMFKGTSFVRASNKSFLKINNCRLKEIEYLSDKPSASDFTNSSFRDGKIIHDLLFKVKQDFNISCPEIGCLSNVSIKNSDKKTRHEIELPLIIETIKPLLNNNDGQRKNKDVRVKWLKTGKPVLKGLNFDVSLSHDKDILICVAGHKKQGCDIETILDKKEKEWQSLLGNEKYKFLKELSKEEPKSINYYGTILWCAFETLKKTTNEDGSKLELISKSEKICIFTHSNLPSNLVIIVSSVKLTKGAERFVSFIGQKSIEEKMLGEGGIQVGGFVFDRSKYKLEVQHEALQNQIVYTKRFPVTFKHTQNLGKSVYFANYFEWMGDIREYCLSPIISDIKGLLETGHWGMATNSTKIKVLGELRADDVVEARFWLQKISGKEDAVYDFMFEWSRVGLNGILDKVALSEQRISWIKITGHGEGELVRPPQVFRDFMNVLKPKNDQTNSTIHSKEFFKNLVMGQELNFRKVAKERLLLKESSVETTLADANLVGNIYFANYSKWLGKVRDTYFYKILSDYYKGVGEKGEFKCLSCDITHLGEAMPFDKVVIKMYLDKLYTNGMDLNFEFYRVQDDRSLQKLAFGRHKIIWCKREGDALYSKNFPDQLKKAILNAA